MEDYKGTAPIKLDNFELKCIEQSNTESLDDSAENIYTLSELFTNELIRHSIFSRVTSLNLPNCNIQHVPSSIKELNLKMLNLNHNKLKEVPSILYSALASLQCLDLSDNFIKKFDIEPACWSVLKTLNLNNNGMESVPQWILIGQAPRLVEFSYSGNHVGKLSTPKRKFQFQTVEMCNARLRDQHIPFLASKLQSLHSLDLSNYNNTNAFLENSFSNIDLLFTAAKWANLTKLSLNYLMMAVVPKSIFQLTTITELNLIGCELSWLPEEIKYLKQLESINVCHNTICALPLELCSLKNLKILKAAFNVISSVAQLTHSLVVLDLYRNALECVPLGLENVEFVDMEQNYVSLLNENWYRAKLDKMRELLISQGDSNGSGEEKKRINGLFVPVNAVLSPYQDETLSCELSDDENTAATSAECCSIINCNDIIEENWDDVEDEVEIDTNYIRNPEITASDDEWNGCEEYRLKSQSKNVQQAQYYNFYDESHQFCDV